MKYKSDFDCFQLHIDTHLTFAIFHGIFLQKFRMALVHLKDIILFHLTEPSCGGGEGNNELPTRKPQYLLL